MIAPMGAQKIASLIFPNYSGILLLPSEVNLSLRLILPRMLTSAMLCDKMSKLFAGRSLGSPTVTCTNLRDELLALPYKTKPGDVPLMGRIRQLTSNLFLEDIYSNFDSQSGAAVYLFKKVADDVFFNFGQDSSVSLDLKLDNGKEALFHIEEVLTPLVKFVQASLLDHSWEGAAKYLRDTAAKYLELVAYFSERRKILA